MGNGEVDVNSEVRSAFDSEFYLAEYPDVRSAGVDPWSHYSTIGWRERRSPTSQFNSGAYLAANADVAAAGIDPFAHYILYGRAEGRHLQPAQAGPEAAIGPTGPDLRPVVSEFDAEHYVAANPDANIQVNRAFDHYLTTGWKEYRDPTRWFSTRRYLEANADVVATGINPFVHYVLHGRREGRELEHGLDFRYDLIRDAANFEAHIQNQARLVPDLPSSSIDDLTKGLSMVANKSAIHITVSHDNFLASLGGVQLCLKIEGEAMRASGAAHIHLFPGRASPVLDVDRENPNLGVLIDSQLIGYFDAQLIGNALARYCKDVFTTLAIHSLIAHRVANILLITRKLTISQAFYWIHDYSSICANYALLRNDAVFCGAPSSQSLACEICVYGSRRQIHFAQHAELFDVVDPVVLAPSEAALSLWRRSFPERERRALIHPHAELVPARRRAARAIPTQTEIGRPLRVGFLGMPTNHKGWPVFAQLAKRFAGDTRYHFHHLAKETDPGLAVDWIRVAPTIRNRAPMIDAVRKANIDVALIWSLWPETFCFAAYEAVAGGAALVANPDSGNVHDLIRREQCGLVVEDDVFLTELFLSGEALRLKRSQRPTRHATLAYSRMTADLILGDRA